MSIMHTVLRAFLNYINKRLLLAKYQLQGIVTRKDIYYDKADELEIEVLKHQELLFTEDGSPIPFIIDSKRKDSSSKDHASKTFD